MEPLDFWWPEVIAPFVAYNPDTFDLYFTPFMECPFTKNIDWTE